VKKKIIKQHGLHHAAFLALVCMFYLPPSLGFASGIECGKAKTPVEIEICGNPQILEADAKMADVYASVMRMLSPFWKDVLRDTQNRWLAERSGLTGSGLLASEKKRLAEIMEMASAYPEVKWTTLRISDLRYHLSRIEPNLRGDLTLYLTTSEYKRPPDMKPSDYTNIELESGRELPSDEKEQSQERLKQYFNGTLLTKAYVTRETKGESNFVLGNYKIKSVRGTDIGRPYTRCMAPFDKYVISVTDAKTGQTTKYLPVFFSSMPDLTADGTCGDVQVLPIEYWYQGKNSLIGQASDNDYVLIKLTKETFIKRGKIFDSVFFFDEKDIVSINKKTREQCVQRDVAKNYQCRHDVLKSMIKQGNN